MIYEIISTQLGIYPKTTRVLFIVHLSLPSHRMMRSELSTLGGRSPGRLEGVQRMGANEGVSNYKFTIFYPVVHHLPLVLPFCSKGFVIVSS